MITNTERMNGRLDLMPVAIASSLRQSKHCVALVTLSLSFASCGLVRQIEGPSDQAEGGPALDLITSSGVTLQFREWSSVPKEVVGFIAGAHLGTAGQTTLFRAAIRHALESESLNQIRDDLTGPRGSSRLLIVKDEYWDLVSGLDLDMRVMRSLEGESFDGTNIYGQDSWCATINVEIEQSGVDSMPGSVLHVWIYNIHAPDRWARVQGLRLTYRVRKSGSDWVIEFDGF